MLGAWRTANPIATRGLAHCQAQSWLGLVSSRPNAQGLVYYQTQLWLGLARAKLNAFSLEPVYVAKDLYLVNFSWFNVFF
jgi:hypothetical protein